MSDLRVDFDWRFAIYLQFGTPPAVPQSLDKLPIRDRRSITIHESQLTIHNSMTACRSRAAFADIQNTWSGPPRAAHERSVRVAHLWRQAVPAHPRARAEVSCVVADKMRGDGGPRSSTGLPADVEDCT
jgi:hypothetical protein